MSPLSLPHGGQKMSEAIMLVGDQIPMARLLMIRQGLALELTTGMRLTRKAASCQSIVKSEFGLKGRGAKLFNAFDQIVTDLTGIEYEGQRPE